ncbi:MAG: hypothetical protein ABIC82_03495 [bacterium]
MIKKIESYLAVQPIFSIQKGENTENEEQRRKRREQAAIDKIEDRKKPDVGKGGTIDITI